jgi:hypothetical protein
MFDQAFWTVQRSAGAILLLSALAVLIGGLMFAGRRGMQPGAPPPSRGYLVVERSFFMAGAILAAIGFIVLEGYLQASAGHILAQVGATAYLLAATLMVTAESLGLAPGEKYVYPLIVVYVVLAFLAQAAIGGALLQSHLLPLWIGYAAIAWNLIWLIVLPITSPSDVYFPVLHHFVPLLLGIFLLWRG